MSGNYGPAPLDRYFPTQAGVLVWLGRAAAERPQTLLWLFILAHATWWATAGSLLQYTMTADNFEMAAWGREWRLGYWKHPPLLTWLIDLVFVPGPLSIP